ASPRSRREFALAAQAESAAMAVKPRKQTLILRMTWDTIGRRIGRRERRVNLAPVPSLRHTIVYVASPPPHMMHQRHSCTMMGEAGSYGVCLLSLTKSLSDSFASAKPHPFGWSHDAHTTRRPVSLDFATAGCRARGPLRL